MRFYYTFSLILYMFKMFHNKFNQKETKKYNTHLVNIPKANTILTVELSKPFKGHLKKNTIISSILQYFSTNYEYTFAEGFFKTYQ